MGHAYLQIADVNRLRAVDIRLAYAFAADGPFLHYTGQGETAGARTLRARAADSIIQQYRAHRDVFDTILAPLTQAVATIAEGESRAAIQFNWGLANAVQVDAVVNLEAAAEARGVSTLHLLYGVPEALVEAISQPSTSDILGMLLVGNMEQDIIRAAASVARGRLMFMSPKESWTPHEARSALCANFLIHGQGYALLKAGATPDGIRAISDSENSALLETCLFSGATPAYAVAALAAGVQDTDAIVEGSANGTPVEYLIELAM